MSFFSLFFFLSLSLHTLGRVSGVNETQSFTFPLPNNPPNPTNRCPGPPAAVGRKDGGLFTFTFWLFMSISVMTFTQSSFHPPLYAILGFRSMVYATICFVAVLVFGQYNRSIFLGKFPPRRMFPFFFQSFEQSLIILCDHIISCFPIAEDHPKLPLLTPFPPQRTLQTLRSCLSVHISPSNPSAATSPTSMTPPTKIPTHPACIIHHVPPLPMAPTQTPFVLKSILRTVHPQSYGPPCTSTTI